MLADISLTLRQLHLLSGDEDAREAVTITTRRAAESYAVLLEQAHVFTSTLPSHNQQLMTRRPAACGKGADPLSAGA